MKYYAIKMPDGEWIMCFATERFVAWDAAAREDNALRQFYYKHGPWAAAEHAEAAGYTCVEVSGFVEVGK